MRTHTSAVRLTACALLLMIAGCSTLTENKALGLIRDGHEAEGLAMLGELGRKAPAEYRMSYIRERDGVTRRLLQEARQLEAKGQPDEAARRYRAILAFDAENAAARQALEVQDRRQRQDGLVQQAKSSREAGDNGLAQSLLERVLAEEPRHAEARLLQQNWDIEQQRDTLTDPPLKAALRKPVSIEFRNAGLQAVFDVLSQSSGLNFIFDRDVKTDLKTTIYARNTRIEDALGLILRTNQLSRKVLNDSTLLIYPDTPEKQKQYADLIVRSFYLGAADPRKVQDMLRTLVSPKSMYVDDKMRLLVIRDTLDVIETVEKLVRNYDIADPEVTLDVEVLEVSSDKLLNLGIQYPDQISGSVYGAAGKAGELTIDEIRNLNRGDFKLHVPDPLAAINFKQTSGNANILANPQIRVRNREKAKVLIGDKVPVVTTTTNQTSSSISESVSYLDVGLKLEVEPEVHVDNDVSITVGLEVSNIVKEVKSSTGLLTYQIGTRNANTVLRLHDGETQMLAGLLKDEERNSASHLPGLGKLPLIGKLFSNESGTKSKSEIVLLITPHVVRGLATPAANGIEFVSGTESAVSPRPLRLPDAMRLSQTDSSLLPKATRTALADTAHTTGKTTPVTSEPQIARALPEAPAPTGTPDMLGLNDEPPALQLDLVSPAQIPAGQEFTVAVMLTGESFASLDANLNFDAAGLSLVRAAPAGPNADFNARQEGQTVRLHLGSTSANSGPIIMLTLRATQPNDKPITLALNQVVALKSADQPMTVQTAPARTLLVTP